MIFERVDEFDMRGLTYSRVPGQGFYIDTIGLIRLQNFRTRMHPRVDIWTQEYDPDQENRLKPVGEVIHLIAEQIYQINQSPVFIRCRAVDLRRGNAVRFKLDAPLSIKIVREERLADSKFLKNCE
jgi:hypothetical protein